MNKNLKKLIEEIINEEVLRLGPSSVEVGPVEVDMDLMSVAQDMLSQDDLQGLEELVDLNNAVYTSIDKRDAWEAIGEQMLTAWGFDAPAQGKKAAAESGDDSGGSVATFWDVRKGGTLYSVKTSFKNPTGPNNYKQATQSSNIKLTALFSAVKENPPGTMLGNIGCIYSEAENSRTVGWGDVTSPISTDELKEKIRALIEKNSEPDQVQATLAAYDGLVGSSTGKKMSKSEAASAKQIVAVLQKAGLVSSGARLTGKMTEFMGAYAETPIASLTVYEPGFFYSETLAKKSGSRGGEDAADEDTRKNAVKRISTLARGMSASQLDRLLSAAREMMQESLMREFIREALLTEAFTKTDERAIETMARKQIDKKWKDHEKKIEKMFDDRDKTLFRNDAFYKVIARIYQELQRAYAEDQFKYATRYTRKDIPLARFRPS